jgi:hypothetical protein
VSLEQRFLVELTRRRGWLAGEQARAVLDGLDTEESADGLVGGRLLLAQHEVARIVALIAHAAASSL